MKKRITLRTRVTDLIEVAKKKATPGGFVEMRDGGVCRACFVGEVALMAGLKPNYGTCASYLIDAEDYDARTALAKSRWSLSKSVVQAMEISIKENHETVADLRDRLINCVGKYVLKPANRLGRI